MSGRLRASVGGIARRETAVLDHRLRQELRCKREASAEHLWRPARLDGHWWPGQCETCLILVRREQPQDADAISAVITAAFSRASETAVPAETELVKRLRADTGWLARLSLVAVAEDAVLGHVVCTRGHVDDQPALGLGPISVLPADRRAGVGRALMHAVLGAAEAIDESLVCVLGDPAFYRQFGFVVASELGIGAPDPNWGSAFHARVLSRCPPDRTGTFRYASPFAELGLA